MRLGDFGPMQQPPDEPTRRYRTGKRAAEARELPVLKASLVADMAQTMARIEHELVVNPSSVLNGRSPLARERRAALVSLHRFFSIHETEKEWRECPVCE